MSKKTLIAMSGGVDSSVAAALLKKQGHPVEGVFIFFQKPEKVLENFNSAKKVAAHLNIPLHTLDLQEDFKKYVLDPFIQGYKNGRTPNPCIGCNKYLKFGKLLDMAKKLNCDHIATGHYARIKNNKLITAKDKAKDQSYFLYELNQEKLAQIMFPLANMYKSQVKKLAKKFNLPVDVNRESSDLCFIKNTPACRQGRDLRGFLKTRIHTDPGNIIGVDGKKFGKHDGLVFYTLGQRQGIKIGGSGPYYVVKKDFKNNTLIVTNNPRDPQLFSDKLTVKNINWISGQEPQLPLECLAQHRYQTLRSEVRITKTQDAYLIEYKKPQRAITPGQSIVFYKPVRRSIKGLLASVGGPIRRFFNQDFEVLGGGIIN